MGTFSAWTSDDVTDTLCSVSKVATLSGGFPMLPVNFISNSFCIIEWMRVWFQLSRLTVPERLRLYVRDWDTPFQPNVSSLYSSELHCHPSILILSHQRTSQERFVMSPKDTTRTGPRCFCDKDQKPIKQGRLRQLVINVHTLLLIVWYNSLCSVVYYNVCILIIIGNRRSVI